MHDLAFALNTTVDAVHAGGEHHSTVFLEGFHPDYRIGNPGLLLQRDELTPLAEPGRCRTRTTPAAFSH
ncbi:hypothetical protein X737_29105 [Mesorhizobium sp. L48C026A00]|nr:hypothetical protein X737_29105 [Mesorhizobium sp. L48C026A00]